jgi:hypothetical protein
MDIIASEPSTVTMIIPALASIRADDDAPKQLSS